MKALAWLARCDHAIAPPIPTVGAPEATEDALSRGAASASARTVTLPPTTMSAPSSISAAALFSASTLVMAAPIVSPSSPISMSPAEMV
jgi:hypothetical protein